MAGGETPDLAAATAAFEADVQQGIGEPSLAATAARLALDRTVGEDEEERIIDTRGSYRQDGKVPPEYYN